MSVLIEVLLGIFVSTGGYEYIHPKNLEWIVVTTLEKG